MLIATIYFLQPAVPDRPDHRVVRTLLVEVVFNDYAVFLCETYPTAEGDRTA